ncbi:unnamed protein product [Paramecium sonneborni]|uniref:TNFR-Cys domain-containing protein n=1 Tax=Paramecium sonneborni TaxID=65129 RepID=A0A8S1KIS1_9CILI|nr:unnamed protein product [Paramecium sonneborni]
MCFLLKAILILLPFVNEAQKLRLQDSKPLIMDCKTIDERDNGFVGSQYFYKYLSQSGNMLNLNKITFSFWMMVYSKMKLNGKQILFGFVDGYTNTPYLNLMLYYQIEQGDYYMYLVNQRFSPEIIKLKLVQENDLYIGNWNHLLLSIDQSTINTFINLKFFSTYDYSLNQIQETLVNQKLNYKFGIHSRITNEQLYNTPYDYKACVNIANFDYFNGWTTMDSEIYLDYDLELKYFLKPYKLIGLNVNDVFMNVILRSTTNPIQYSNSIGLVLYKNTQIVYNFIEQLSSFTMMFWIKPSNIVSTFQFLSLTDDALQQTSVGFGINKDYNLLFHQNYDKLQLGSINDNTWAHVTAGFLELSLDQDFQATNSKKLLRVFIDNIQVTLRTITNVIQYRRLVFGPVFMDDMGLEMIDIQDIRIFKGYNILEANGDCQLFVGDYCAFCLANTHYCKEQDPNDDINIYKCPAGYRESGANCIPVTIPNCLRQSGTTCSICANNYYVRNGQCQIISTQLSPYSCTDQFAIFCQNTKIKIMSTYSLDDKSKLCQNTYNQHNPVTYQCEQIKQQICLQAQYLTACYNCNNGYFLTELNTCQRSCTANNRFQLNKLCLKKCPGRYLYGYNCLIGMKNPTYSCNTASRCNNNELTLNYYCLRSSEQTGQVGICVPAGSTYKLVYEDCDPLCKYCFGTQPNQCLGCYDNKFFSPYYTTCLDDCNTQSKFKFNNRDWMVCELECPTGYLTQDFDCVRTCSNGYAKYNLICLPITSITDNYLSTQTIPNQQPIAIFVDCPELCQTCTSDTYCTTCLNYYPMNQNKCVPSCYPKYLYIDENNLNICLSACDPSDLVYDNINIDGFSIRQCFKIKCGQIKTNRVYQTYMHQTNTQLCMYPCDAGYYTLSTTMQCTKCSTNCATCYNSATTCTSCYPTTFLSDNDCFKTCKSKFRNYINWQCEGSCSIGFTIDDQIQSIQACVSKCGQVFGNFVYSLNNRCYDIKPIIGAYCIANDCYNCYYNCKTCSGPTNIQCLSCYEKTFFLSNSCVMDCGNLFYDLINWKCVNVCPNSSYTTSGYQIINTINTLITSCSSTCLYNQFQYRDLCSNIQPIGTYCVSKTNYSLCDNCAAVCKTCFDSYSTTCTECNPGTFLSDTTCSTECPENIPFKDTINNICVITCTSYEEDGYCVAACSPNYYIYEAQKSCYEFGCPEGTYNQINTLNCYSCAVGCATCTDGTSNQCITCLPSYFLYGVSTCTNICNINPDLLQDWVNGKCVKQCPSGTFLQSLANGQLACKDTCPIYYYSNICVTTCPNQTYIDGLICNSCAGPCSECYGGEVDQCTKCDSGYYIADTTCVEVCPSTKPYANLATQACVTSCPDYLYLAQKVCFSFCPGFLANYELDGKKECVEQCYSNSYLSSGQCQLCDPICKECYGPINGNCLECKSPYFLYQQKCQITCPFYSDYTDNTCKESCPSNTVIQGMRCQTQCDTGYLLYSQFCVLSCPTFTYKVANNCILCNSICRTCFGSSANECYTCIDNYLLNGNTCTQTCPILYDYQTSKCLSTCGTKLEVTDTKSCVTTCPIGYLNCNQKCLSVLPEGYYSDGVQCQKCNTKCSKCTSPTVCQACNQNFYLHLQTCNSFCTNKYLYMDPISRECVSKCPFNLYHQESFDKRFCVTDCPQKLNDQCVISCPDGMYLKDTFCTNCPQKCQSCTSSTNCTSCKNDYFLENGLCYSSCIVGKTDYKNHVCVENCDATLFEYQNECLESCPTNPILYYHKNICMNQCPTNTFQNNQECLDCDISCLTCIGPSPDDCIICKQNYYLYNQQCVLTCPNLYNEIDQTCVISCPPNLLLDQNKCVSMCSQYMYFNTCLTTCPPKTYNYNFNCYDCSQNCLECNQYGCQKCENGSFLNDGICGSFCPYFYNFIMNQCEQQCPDETFIFIDQCYASCPANTYNYYRDCLLECPKKTILIGSICQQCPERCLICKNQYECLNCDSPYFQFEGQCVVGCPSVLPFQNTIQNVCQSECSPDTFEKEYQCVKECDLIIYQNKCLKQCPYGYYGKEICKPCKLECKACNDFNICTECQDNFYLEQNQCDTQCTKIKDLKQKKCVDSCSLFLYQKVCYETCPTNTYQFGNKCLQKCQDGYFGSEDFRCVKCPSQCNTCLNLDQCNSCKIGYYLYQQKCLDQCPDKLFSNPLISQCTTSCPIKTYIFQNQCLYECPTDYLNDTDNYKCVLKCNEQQYLNKNSCYSCSIECNKCTDFGNQNCIQCATNYNLTEEGYCFGKCKAGYYQTEKSCEKCLHKCLTCENGSECLQCRGTNRNPIDCLCPKGYYDDQYYDNCQKCPCEECISESQCVVCKNNLQVPNCSCNRRLNDDWCITCQIGQVNIYYSDDLNSIIVYFGYLISVNLINPFQPSSCSLWFDQAEIFGDNAQCYLSWDRYSVNILLEPYASVNIGDQLSFKQSFYRDVNQGLCDGIYIDTFIENIVKGPSALTKPYILFDVPSIVSTCKTIYIKQILLDGTAKKIQNVLSWYLHEMDNDDYYLQMDAFLANQLNEFTIPISTLSPNVTYTITAKYINFLQRVNFTTFSFTTLPYQVPYVYLQYNPLIARVYVFDCQITYADMKNEFNLAIHIFDSDNQTYINLIQEINPIYEIPLNETLLPKETPLFFIASTGSSVIHEVIYLQSKKIDIEFLQTNRFIGLDNQINARGFDRNIQNEILSTINIEYQWQCNNLFNLQPCKTEENKIMQFPSRRIADIYADSQNTTFVFFAKASKGNRWTVKEQLIVVTDFDIEEEFVLNQEKPTNYINVNDEITILIRNNQKYAFIMQEFKILSSIKITSKTLQFRLAGLVNDYSKPIYIYLVPGNESISFGLNKPPSKIQFSIEPLQGDSLDYFNYSILNLEPEYTVSIYYYFEKSVLQNDVNLQSINNGLPLVTYSKEISGSFQLPNGIVDNAISVLCQVESNYGSKSYFELDIKVKRKNYEINKLYESFQSSTNFSNLQSIHTMTKLIQLEQQQVCLKQCSGVGICVNDKCKCPPGYYFEDCSGTKEQYQNFTNLIKNVKESLIKNAITNNDEFRLFSQSLLFVSTLKDQNYSYSISDSQQILEQYVLNVEQRLEKINQYSINLQYQSSANLNYSQIDIRSLVNKNDLHTALKSTVFMWEKTLFTEDAGIYELQNRLSNFLSNTIELSLFAIQPDEIIDYSIDTAYLKIQRINNISDFIVNRLLIQSTEDKTSQLEYYDFVKAIYIRNYFAFDGYYPYPQQLYPLYDYQIRHQNRKQNIQLKTYISYKFGIQNDTFNLVCLIRNSLTYEWSNQNCTLNQVNQTYFCNCTTLAPTTICNDYDFLYQGTAQFNLQIPNLLYIIYFFQLIILGIFICKVKSLKNQKSLDQTKFGQVLKLARKDKIAVFGNQIVPVDDEKQSSPIQQSQPQQKEHNVLKDKFSFNNFWKHHCLTSLIYKNLFYFSTSLRSILIILRWNQAIIIGEILHIFGFQYNVSMWIILSSIIFSRIFEFFLKTQAKYFTYMKQFVILFIIKIFLSLVMIATFLFGIYVYFMINNQTNLIISYSFAILMDLLFLDILLFTTNKFFGQEKKRLVRKKIKEFQSIAKAQNFHKL